MELENSEIAERKSMANTEAEIKHLEALRDSLR
jgi:hypothetical protein